MCIIHGLNLLAACNPRGLAPKGNQEENAISLEWMNQKNETELCIMEGPHACPREHTHASQRAFGYLGWCMWSVTKWEWSSIVRKWCVDRLIDAIASQAADRQAFVFNILIASYTRHHLTHEYYYAYARKRTRTDELTNEWLACSFEAWLLSGAKHLFRVIGVAPRENYADDSKGRGASFWAPNFGECSSFVTRVIVGALLWMGSHSCKLTPDEHGRGVSWLAWCFTWVHARLSVFFFLLAPHLTHRQLARTHTHFYALIFSRLPSLI